MAKYSDFRCPSEKELVSTVTDNWSSPYAADSHII